MINKDPCSLEGKFRLVSRVKSGWHLALFAAIFSLASPILAVGAERESLTTVSWVQVSKTPSDQVGVGFLPDPALTGSFVGEHRGVVIVAGGAALQQGPREFETDDVFDGTYSQSIWFSARDPLDGLELKEDAFPVGRDLDWQEATVTLSNGRAFGASASHDLGLIMVGGSGGKVALSDVDLIRWDHLEQRLSIAELPQLPVRMVNGGAVVIGNTLFVVASNDDEGSKKISIHLTFPRSKQTALESPSRPVIGFGFANGLTQMVMCSLHGGGCQSYLLLQMRALL